ncbi:DMT family transporter [Roseovarius sp. EL26]|uniref:DMT family transporter n=1 Tax=Roseovarius sp. EL26 TaxID=2126672 RepID=UPI000EA25519|nr:DMT family transporter [Roseovarius sp. EL26]
MTRAPIIWATFSGVALTVLYTLLISGADGITKFIAKSYAAPQLFALSGGIVAGLSLLGLLRGKGTRGLQTSCPEAMLIRSVATVSGTITFFHAFRLLPFAEVFLFIAMIPLLAALVSGPLLKEPVQSQVWGALIVGVVGILFLFPSGIKTLESGHLIALLAAFCGTVSMVASRFIGLREDNLLAQVLYPNLMLMLVMTCALPFVFEPMSLHDLGWVIVYAVCLFAARWVLVAALRLLPAYVVTPLMNLQFLWMVVIGYLVFGERPAYGVFLGAVIVAGAGLWLIYLQIRTVDDSDLVPAE